MRACVCACVCVWREMGRVKGCGGEGVLGCVLGRGVWYRYGQGLRRPLHSLHDIPFS